MVSFRRNPVLVSMVAVGGGETLCCRLEMCARSVAAPQCSGTGGCSSRRGVACVVCMFCLCVVVMRWSQFIYRIREYVVGIVVIQ